MPIKISCENCSVTLRVPDAAAGKKIKCPKCGTATPVPAAVEDSDPERTIVDKLVDEPATAKARKRDADERSERDDDDDDERPRRKRRGKKQASSSKGLWLGLGIGGAALGIIAAVVVFIMMTTGSGADTTKVDNKQTKAKEQPPPQNKLPIGPPKNDAGIGPGPGERTVSQNNLLQIGLAFHDYNESKSFPMSSVGGQGKLSWRVAILIELGNTPLFNKFNLKEPWDSADNLDVMHKYAMPKEFRAARTKPEEDSKPYLTYLRLFTGPGTCYPTADARPKVGTLARGSNNVWLLAEGKTPIEWTRPDELEIKDGKLPPLGGVYGGDFYVMTAAGKPHFVRRSDFSPDQMLNLINPDGGHVQGWPPD